MIIEITMAKKKSRHKNDQLKKQEDFKTGIEALKRVGLLGTYEHVDHVKVSKEEKTYFVNYSVARWFWDELQENNLKL